MKKPPNSYMLWRSKHLSEIKASLPDTADRQTVSQAVAQAWKDLPEKKKTKWTRKQQELKKAYDEYIAAGGAPPEKKARKKKEKEQAVWSLPDFTDEQLAAEILRRLKEVRNIPTGSVEDAAVEVPSASGSVEDAAYTIWYTTKGKALVEASYGSAPDEVMHKEARKLWEGMSEKKKARWADRAASAEQVDE
uniref:HMG-box-like protein n=1 Tax=Karlodinium veneficum TaxID=407301 RepID=A7YXU3_KARVE|nr:HMG-box-like protein [Karlodinium veneficum]